MCHEDISQAPFVNINAVGEPTDATIVLYGEEYYLCPACAREIYNTIFDSKNKGKGGVKRD